MAQGYLVIQIDLAHFRAQLIVSLAVTGILEINIGTVLMVNCELRRGEPRGCSLVSAYCRLPCAHCRLLPTTYRQLASAINTVKLSEKSGAEMCKKGVFLGDFRREKKVKNGVFWASEAGKKPLFEAGGGFSGKNRTL